jgi:RimJ/RimL family protein N-acetyltransferase
VPRHDVEMQREDGEFELRPLEATDADWIMRACQDGEIQRWTLVPRPYRRDHAEGFVRGEHPELEVRVIDSRQRQREPFGVVSIHGVTSEGVAELGYWIAPWGRRLGAASAALTTMTERAFAEHAARRCVVRIADGNVGSQAVARRAGYLPAGRNDGECVDGTETVDALVFSKERRPEMTP